MLGLRRHGEEKEAAQAPSVWLHGFLCSGEFFAPNIAALARQRPIITVDLPGFGSSQRAPARSSIAGMAEAVLATLRAHNIPSFHLLGHSMGGMVAIELALAAARQVQSLCIYASNSSGQLPDRFESFATSKQRLAQDFDAAKKQIAATWFRDGSRHPHFHFVEKSSAAVALDTAEKAIDAMSAFDRSKEVRGLEMPVLIISPELDRTYSLRCQAALKKSIPHAQQETLPGCAHCAHLEDEDGFNRIMLASAAFQSPPAC